MLKPYLTFIRAATLVSCVIPYAVLAYNVMRKTYGLRQPCEWPDLWLKFAVIATVTGAAAYTVARLPRWLGRSIQFLSVRQSRHIQTLNPRVLDVAVLGSAALSLLLELAVIRWQGSVFEIFALYKNFGLLACFLGLGLGYALSSRKLIPLVLAPPLLTWQMIVLAITKYGPPGWNTGLLRVTPVTEQLNMGVVVATKLYEYVAVYGFLATVFVLTALVFIPIGQLCGAVMDQRPRLRAYGLNLLGSLLGVAAIFVFSMMWTPPVLWFVVCLLGIIIFMSHDRQALLTGAAAMTVAIAVLTWPTDFLWEKIHSPYQLVERGFGPETVTRIRAAGYYYQEIHDYSHLRPSDSRDVTAQYYELPYRVFETAQDIAIVGAGSGNDVAAALRCGIRSVDAIEIDPAILQIGRHYHPEKPYSNQRVKPIVNDARSFLRNTEKRYDMIVYGLLDSHTLLSHASSVRIDSFVYTVDAFREARARLRDGGAMSLSFCLLSPEMGRKIYLMLKEAFDGADIVCLSAQKDGAVVYLVRDGRGVSVPNRVLAGGAFTDVTPQFADSMILADVSTDDWPFFYMPRRVYPLSYVTVIGMIMALSWILIRPFFKGQTDNRPRLNHGVFFLLGSGFMLIETKAITELGLTFGNTWHVIGIVIAGILAMAFVANCAVQWLRIQRLTIPFGLLMGSLALGMMISKSGGFGSTTVGRISTLLVLTCPMFFSGLCFSTMLRYTTDISRAMAANLIGAMAGGLLEYNSMYFGFQWLYGLALAVYGLAMVLSVTRCRTAVTSQRHLPWHEGRQAEARRLLKAA